MSSIVLLALTETEVWRAKQLAQGHGEGSRAGARTQVPHPPCLQTSSRSGTGTVWGHAGALLLSEKFAEMT